jgi:adenine/guanine phosphoribosyltransferase-like PRPP-binding protein
MTERHTNTFNEYFEGFSEFLKKILGWNPDYVVPVAKKACKLLKTLPDTDAFRQNPDLIKYRNYFKFTNSDIRGKRIAVVDDATQYTSTLQEYRRYFENLGATVRTFSFVGH